MKLMLLVVALRALTVILYILYLGVLSSLIYGIGEVAESDSDKGWAEICDWPLEDLYTYHRIGRTVGPGGYAADIWKSIYIQKSELSALNRLNAARKVYGEKTYREIREAIADNFRLSDVLPKDLEADITKVVTIVKNSCEELKRRTALIERLKDMLMYIGLATVLGVFAFFLSRILNKLEEVE